MRDNPAEAKAMGIRLKELRESRGMTQPKLAEAIGVPVGTLRNWEQGRVLPQLGAAYRLAKALSISLDELAGKVFAEPSGEKATAKGKGKRTKE